MTSDEQAIANLLARYAELLDLGDFKALGSMFQRGTVRFDGVAGATRGAAEVAALYSSFVLVHDGNPRTKHVTTNISVVVNDDIASSNSYYTVLQEHDDLPLQIVAAGRYNDIFKRYETWEFEDRLIYRDLVGDLKYHIGPDPYHSERHVPTPSARFS